MSTLVCLGFGYCAQRHVATGATRFAGMLGTVRRPEVAAAMGNSGEVVAFDGARRVDQVAVAIAACQSGACLGPARRTGRSGARHIRGSAENGSPARNVVYLSSIGVCGDHGGGLVDEATLPSPHTERARARLAAEAAWQAFGRETGMPVAVLRLAGISGPGRNALMDVLQGRARRVIKPGQLFNRIHVDDIVRTIDVAFSRRASGMFNVCDDEPSPAYHVVEFAVKLPGRERRPQIGFAEAQATMTPMMRSLYAENKRVRSLALSLRTELGVRLPFPTYRDGLRAELESTDPIRVKNSAFRTR